MSREQAEHAQHTGEIEALREQLNAADITIEHLKRIIAKELTENDDLGTEFVYVNALKEQLAEMKWEYENACKFTTDFENRLAECQAENKRLHRAFDGETDWHELYTIVQAQNAALLAALNRIENECSCDTPEVCYDVACDALSANPQAALGAVRKAQKVLDHVCMMVDEPERSENALEALNDAFGKGGDSK